MIHVKITARVETPLVLSAEGLPPCLDAIVEWVVSQKQKSIEAASNGRHKAAPRGINVTAPGLLYTPFATERVDGFSHKIPRVSDGIAVGREFVERFAKRFPMEQHGRLLDKERTKVNLTGGEFKSYYLPLRACEIDHVVWFATVKKTSGKRRVSPLSDFRRLLRKVHQLGKKSAHGYGRISEWVVERVEDDYSWFAPHPQGRVLMRRLPTDYVQKTGNIIGFRPWYGGIVAPYWQRDFWGDVALPC